MCIEEPRLFSYAKGMDQKALEIAKSRLRVAQRALADAKSAIDNPTLFAEHWFVFLTAWKSIYTVLEQGSKASPQSRQWYGGKKAERRDDPLLQYLFEARNDEAHGLAITVRHTDGGYLFKATTDIESMRIRMVDGHPVPVDDEGNVVGELIQQTPPGPELQHVNARGNRILNPPSEHLGRKVDVRPVPVAELAIEYADQLIKEAETLSER